MCAFDTFWHVLTRSRTLCERCKVCSWECQKMALSIFSDTPDGCFFDTFWHGSMPLRIETQIVSKKCLTRGRVLTFFDTLYFWHVLTLIWRRLQPEVRCQQIVSTNVFFTRFDTFWHEFAYVCIARRAWARGPGNSVRKFLTRLLGCGIDCNVRWPSWGIYFVRN